MEYMLVMEFFLIMKVVEEGKLSLLEKSLEVYQELIKVLRSAFILAIKIL